MLKGDSALHVRKIHGVRGIGNVRRSVENERHALGAGQGLLEALKEICKARNRSVEEAQVEDEGHDILDGELPFVREITSEKYNQHRSGSGEKLHAGVEDGACPKGAEHCHNLLKALASDALALVFLLAEGLNLMQAREAVLELGVEFAHGLLGSAEKRAYHLGEDDT